MADETRPVESDEDFWDAYVAACCTANAGDQNGHRDAVRTMWTAAAAELRRGGIDIGIADWLAGMIDELLEGRQPLELTVLQAKAPDKRRNEGMLFDAVKMAVIYRQTCEAGAIADETPAKTIADAYGVDNETVRRWNKDIQFAADLWETYRPHLTPEQRIKRIKLNIEAYGRAYSLTTASRNTNKKSDE